MSAVAPVLLITFNRPELTERVFAGIAEAKPAKLYLASDGARDGVEGESAKVERCRRYVLDNVDWECEVKTLFQEQNLGCGKAPAAALDWFFSHEREGMVLEDDCLASENFFRFCTELLERYRDDTRVMTIAGYNLYPDEYISGDESYFFSNFGFCWGWASWRRAWEKFDFKMSAWADFKAQGKHRMYPFFPRRNSEFDSVYGGKTDVWDYQWSYAVSANSGLSIIPRVSLIQNIGFGEDATHTKVVDNKRAGVRAGGLDFPLRHPLFVFPNADYEQELLRPVPLYKRFFGIFRRVRRLLARV